MTSLFAVTGGWIALVLAVEVALWLLFKSRVANICRFPMVVVRLRLIVVFHALILCLILFVAHLALW